MVRIPSILSCIAVVLLICSVHSHAARITGDIAIEYMLCESQGLAGDCVDPIFPLEFSITVKSPNFDPWVLDQNYDYIPSNWDIVDLYVELGGVAYDAILGNCYCDLSAYQDDYGFGSDPGPAVYLLQNGDIINSGIAPLDFEFSSVWGDFQIFNSPDFSHNFFSSVDLAPGVCASWYSTTTEVCYLDLLSASYDLKIPEPGIFALFAVGFFGLWSIRRKRQPI